MSDSVAVGNFKPMLLDFNRPSFSSADSSVEIQILDVPTAETLKVLEDCQTGRNVLRAGSIDDLMALLNA